VLVVVDPVGDGIEPGEDRGVRDGGEGAGGLDPLQVGPLPGQPVEVRRLRLAPAGDAEVIPAPGVDRDQEDRGAGGLGAPREECAEQDSAREQARGQGQVVLTLSTVGTPPEVR